MKKIGIQVEPWGYDRFVFTDQFLLTSDEANEMTSRLRKTGMDTFKGNIPDNLLPQKIPGLPFQGIVFGRPESINHPNIESWEVRYHEGHIIPKANGKPRELDLYPRLELKVSSSEEGHVLTARPYITFFLDFKGEDRRTDNYDKLEFIDLVVQYLREEKLGDEKTAGFITRGHGAINEGWNFAPTSNMPLVCQGAIHCATHVSQEELRKLGALRQIIYTDSLGRNVYQPDERYTVELARKGAEKEYHSMRRDLVSKMQQTKLETDAA